MRKKDILNNCIKNKVIDNGQTNPLVIYIFKENK